MSTLKGIDISSWQGTVDFTKVKSAGIQFLILRDGFSKTVDKQFHNYVAGAKAAGIPIYGVYHFSYALNADQARKEAEFCLKEVEKAGLGKNTIIFFDLEYDSVSYAAKNGVTIGKTACNAHTKAFCERIEEAGYRAGIYCNLDYYRNMYDHSLLSKYIFWLADWSGAPDYPCDFHQYTSKGSVSGISGNVDMNYCYNDVYEKTETEPAEEKTIDELAYEVLAGLWGNGSFRKEALRMAGYNFVEVQNRVNEILYAQSKKTNDELAKEVLDGKWGNGDARKKALTAAGYNYSEVQDKVNKILYGNAKKTVDELAKEVLDGKWGNGNARKKALITAGYNYNDIQKRVNELIAASKTK